ncbi:MAG: aminoacyl-tRNA hydrolase [bacterium]|nr:aminoacyl-tRNA hydrolase [bacterium]
MYLVVGLGNYPKEYDLTRHNIGFMCIDNFAQKYSADFRTETKFKADMASVTFNGEKLLLLKPLTYMNLSGEAIQKAAAFYKIEPQKTLVIYDDISLDLGKFRFRAEGSDGGHNGIKSIIQNLSTDKFPRLKIGIGPQPQNLKAETFVLQKFSLNQMATLNKVVTKSVEAIEDYIQLGLTEAQNKYNGINLGTLL